ncbi:MAG: YraN family protein [Rhodospirillaceae bacterium]|jgi:putative endonuclease|nr:YraN family protein [Rhodospirillaceae bacterium]MBT3810608.1 YraN family protein [Rhodospirillaceae bacterium]MBT3931872.1 YraN family protein [Rhodospirillaceae bacterium]MBT4772658.1 YraN family protein [Rhodospirillaceae bacterium]MBT5358164.1 YraN family protein [Rhodospirillaceae bacterium]
MNRTTRRQAAERRGHRAEQHAALLLRLKGFRVLARRYRCRVGEIDIVARRARLLVAVEVKARADFDAAAHAIDRRQRTRIIRATDHFLAANPSYSDYQIRFDAILVAPGKLPRHIPDAWRIE